MMSRTLKTKHNSHQLDGGGGLKKFLGLFKRPKNTILANRQSSNSRKGKTPSNLTNSHATLVKADTKTSITINVVLGYDGKRNDDKYTLFDYTKYINEMINNDIAKRYFPYNQSDSSKKTTQLDINVNLHIITRDNEIHDLTSIIRTLLTGTKFNIHYRKKQTFTADSQTNIYLACTNIMGNIYKCGEYQQEFDYDGNAYKRVFVDKKSNTNVNTIPTLDPRLNRKIESIIARYYGILNRRKYTKKNVARVRDRFKHTQKRKTDNEFSTSSKNSAYTSEERWKAIKYYYLEQIMKANPNQPVYFFDAYNIEGTQEPEDTRFSMKLYTNTHTVDFINVLLYHEHKTKYKSGHTVAFRSNNGHHTMCELLTVLNLIYPILKFGNFNNSQKRKCIAQLKRDNNWDYTTNKPIKTAASGRVSDSVNNSGGRGSSASNRNFSKSGSKTLTNVHNIQ